MAIEQDYTSSVWKKPSPEQAGNVPWIAKTVARLFLKSRAMWAARPDKPREKELIDLLSETCQQMGIHPVPKLFIYDSYKPNAAAMLVGKTIIFSTNLLVILPRDQIKAVMGHELTHYSKQKSKILMAAVGADIASTMATYLTFRTVKNLQPHRPVNRLLQSVSKIPFLTAMAQLSGGLTIYGWFQRRFENEADLGGAAVAGKEAMAGALSTLDTRLKEVQAEEKKQGKHDWFRVIINLPLIRTHEPVPKRIQNILAHGSKSFTERHEATDKSQSLRK